MEDCGTAACSRPSTVPIAASKKRKTEPPRFVLLVVVEEGGTLQKFHIPTSRFGTHAFPSYADFVAAYETGNFQEASAERFTAKFVNDMAKHKECPLCKDEDSDDLLHQFKLADDDYAFQHTEGDRPFICQSFY